MMTMMFIGSRYYIGERPKLYTIQTYHQCKERKQQFVSKDRKETTTGEKML